MEGKRNVINEFETRQECDYSYRKIATTKDNKISFFNSRQQYDPNQLGWINLTTYMVARCSRENMTSIIKQKIKSKRYDASDEKVYILLDEDDFDKTNLSEMKKQHFTFPLFLPYDRIKQQIYDYETEEIDKIIQEV